MPKRPSISGVFPGTENIRTGDFSSSQTTSRCFKNSIRDSIARGWPSWSSLRQRESPVSFTVRLSNRLRAEAGEQNCITAEDRIMTMRQLSLLPFSNHRNNILYQELEDNMIQAIFGSNYIDQVGTKFDITVKLCRSVLRGEHVPVEIPERDLEYAEAIEELKRQLKDATKSNVIRSRVEVIQHARAFDYLVEQFCFHNQTLSEDLLKRAHAILIERHDDPEIKPGVYRDYKMGAQYGTMKKVQFIDPRAVAPYMQQLISDFEAEVLAAEQTRSLDPYLLAAKYYHRFVNIHPFGDGNGRLSRMFMNAILLKYAGHIVPLGEGGESDRDGYIQLAARASIRFREEDMEESQELTGHLEMGSYILKRSIRKLETLVNKLL